MDKILMARIDFSHSDEEENLFITYGGIMIIYQEVVVETLRLDLYHYTNFYWSTLCYL